MKKFIIWLLKIVTAEIVFITGIVVVNEIQDKLNENEWVVENFQTASGEYGEREEKREIPKYENENIYQEEKEETKPLRNKNGTRYFYRQLSENGKVFYNKIYQNRENLKNGNYKIDYGNTFSEYINTEIGKEKIGDDFQSAIEAIIYDNPNIFFLDPNKLYMNVETITKIYKVENKVYLDNGNRGLYLSEGFLSKNDVDMAEREILNEKNKVLARAIGDDYRDIKMVHDYLVDNLSYDTSISNSYIYNIYGAIANKKAVCEGYAKAFKYFMDELEIPCIIVTGDSKNSKGRTEKHAWNYVQIEGKWYAIDTTWDDPIIRGGGKTNNKIKYKYFLKGAEKFNEDHFPKNSFTENGKEFTLPKLSELDYIR